MWNPVSFFLLLSLSVGSARSEECSKELVDVIFQQLESLSQQMQEIVRENGQSGVNSLRNRHSGIENYQTTSHTGASALAMHDHSDYSRTLGMGEFQATLNGVEFKTRHNDYRMVRPSTTSSEIRATEDVPFPEVPPEVLAKTDVNEQIDELREWFKAFVTQNHTVRDYRKYFKPVLCYMEGAWFKSGLGEDIVESFRSKRHSLDASTYESLAERVRFNGYTGNKNRLENLATLPSSIMGKTKDGKPQLAQWNYRILCHPVKRELPPSYVHPVEDLAGRFSGNTKMTFEKYWMASRTGRFGFNAKGNPQRGGQYQHGLLDELMEEIPGLNNYPAKIFSDPKDPDRILSIGGKELLNQGYYHRVSQVEGSDASGVDLVYRGYNDPFFFAAQTDHDQIAGRTYSSSCRFKKNIPADCPEALEQKWTYAIPMELVYLTPLQSWNPYNIILQTDSKLLTGDGTRDGSCTQEKAYNGSSVNKFYYITPVDFFSKATAEGGAADTVRDKVCVLDQDNKVREMRASGIYVHIPKINDINGRIRTRYPVNPIHGEGSSVWKELNAVRDLVMDDDLAYLKYSEKKESGAYVLQMSQSVKADTPIHTHTVQIDAYDAKLLNGNVRITVTTSQEIGHTHVLEIGKKTQNGVDKFYYTKCGGGSDKCWDGHGKDLFLKPE